jgi:hypothetical protein
MSIKDILYQNPVTDNVTAARRRRPGPHREEVRHGPERSRAEPERRCRVCGCTDNDCSQCVATAWPWRSASRSARSIPSRSSMPWWCGSAIRCASCAQAAMKSRACRREHVEGARVEECHVQGDPVDAIEIAARLAEPKRCGGVDGERPAKLSAVLSCSPASLACCVAPIQRIKYACLPATALAAVRLALTAGPGLSSSTSAGRPVFEMNSCQPEFSTTVRSPQKSLVAPGVKETRSAQTTMSVELSVSRCPMDVSCATHACVPLVDRSRANGPEIVVSGA